MSKLNFCHFQNPLAVFQESYPNCSCFFRGNLLALTCIISPRYLSFSKSCYNCFLSKLFGVLWMSRFCFLSMENVATPLRFMFQKGRRLIDALITQRSDGRSDVSKMILIDASGGLRDCSQTIAKQHMSNVVSLPARIIGVPPKARGQ